jgi:hypothetical protein
LDGAQPAIDASLLIDLEVEYIPPRNESEQSSQGTDITAPEPLSDHIQENDTDENGSDKKSLEKDSIDVHVFKKLDQGIADSSQTELIEQSDKSRRTITQSRQDPNDDRTVQKRERIENTDQIEGENGTYQDENKDVILPYSVVILKFFRFVELGLFKDKGKKLVKGSQGTDPSARNPPHKKSEHKGDDGRQEGDKKSAGCQSCSQGQQGIPVEKALHIGDVIFSRESGIDQENEKKAEKKDLCQDPGFLEQPVFFRPFFFQF